MRRLPLVFALVGGMHAVASAQSLGDAERRPFGVTPTHVACLDQPVVAVPVTPLRILSGHTADGRESFVAGDVVVLNGSTPQGVLLGQRYFVRSPRRGREELHSSVVPMTAIRTPGWLTVVASDERFALGRIDYACDAVMRGDYLEAFVEPTMVSAIGPAGAPRFDPPATVLFGADRREQFGAGDLFVIDRGSAQGFAPGMRLAFYRDRRNGAPHVPVGDGHIVEVFTEVARVLVTRAVDAVRRGDLAVPR